MLQVRVTTAYEAEYAEEGGADRLLLTGHGDFSPLPEVVVKVRRASTVHLRVLLRLRAGYVTDGGEMTRLRGLASTYADAGADGFVFGFLNSLSGIDQSACLELAGEGDWDWTFDRAVDAALDQDRAWADLATLPRLDSVLTAGSAREVEQGLDHLIAHSSRTPPLIAAGNLLPEHVPWLVRGGVTRFMVDRVPINSGGIIRAWRSLIDDELARRAPRR